MAAKTRKRTASAAEKERRRRERVEQVEQLRAQLAEQVEQLVTSGGWARMLAAARSLHRYSLRNQLLIMVQAAERGFEPSHVAGYRAWQAMGRQVRKGQRGLRILAPCLVWVDLAEGEALPSNVVKVEQTAKGRRAQVRRFRPTSVWDVSQTDGIGDEDTPDAPTVAEPAAAADDPEALAALRDELGEQVEAAGFTLRYGDPGLGRLGVTIYTDRLVIVDNTHGAAEQVGTLAHELAHITLGHEDHTAHDRKSRREIEAESVAYIVLGAHGIDAPTSASYVTAYAEGDVEEVLAAAERVTEAARQILDQGEADETGEQDTKTDEQTRAGAEAVAA
ncbi:MAG TPA: ArdC-like ssDNA-binding domain-containing protein [Nocardioidaceae bacterium]